MLSSALARLSISSFVQTIFAIKSRSRQKPEQMGVFGLRFWGGETQLFYGRLLARFTVHRLPKFG